MPAGSLAVEKFYQDNFIVGESIAAFSLRAIRIHVDRGYWDAATSRPSLPSSMDVRGAMVAVQQGLVMIALYSGVDVLTKIVYLRDNLDVRLLPDDAAALAAVAASASSSAATATVAALTATAAAATAAAGALTATCTAAERFDNADTADALETAKDAAVDALRLAEEARIAGHFDYDASALVCVLARGDLREMNILMLGGLQLTPLTAARAMRDVIEPRTAPSDFSLDRKASLALLRHILKHVDAVDVCYVYAPDDLTAVGVAVKNQRVDMVQALLDYCPKAVNVAGRLKKLTPAHLVSRENKDEAPRDGRWRFQGLLACRHSPACVHPNCNIVMNRVLYTRGADERALDAKWHRPLLCQSGQDAVARAMESRIRDFVGVLQGVYHKRSTAPMRVVPVDIMFTAIFPHLLWDSGREKSKVVLPCKASQAKYPWFPSKPPESWKVPQFVEVPRILGSSSDSDDGVLYISDDEA
jgi:hypothetical protein